MVLLFVIALLIGGGVMLYLWRSTDDGGSAPSAPTGPRPEDCIQGPGGRPLELRFIWMRSHNSYSLMCPFHDTCDIEHPYSRERLPYIVTLPNETVALRRMNDHLEASHGVPLDAPRLVRKG